jgi:hypoxanthine phosphoribosyltransferase
VGIYLCRYARRNETTGAVNIVAASHKTQHQLNWSDIEHMVNTIVRQIKTSNWQPDIIVALSRGGFVPATMIAYKLGVKTLVGLDVKKNTSGVRSRGSVVSVDNLKGRKVLVVDDSIITGRLLDIVPTEIRTKGGEPRTCALISEGKCPSPDYVVETRDVTPIMPWE